MYAYHCAQLSYAMQHRAVPIIFARILQAIIIAQTLSTRGEEYARRGRWSVLAQRTTNSTSRVICQPVSTCRQCQQWAELRQTNMHNRCHSGGRPTGGQLPVAVGPATARQRIRPDDNLVLEPPPSTRTDTCLLYTSDAADE